MKKFAAILMVLLLVCSMSFAEDAITSATLEMDMLPAVEPADSRILVAYFSPDDTVKAAAYTIAAELDAELFEIIPEEQ